MNKKTLKRALAAVAYTAAGGAPILAATGVGALGAGILAGVGLIAGGVLHFLKSPGSEKDAKEAGEAIAGGINAVKAARGKK